MDNYDSYDKLVIGGALILACIVLIILTRITEKQETRITSLEASLVSQQAQIDSLKADLYIVGYETDGEIVHMTLRGE